MPRPRSQHPTGLELTILKILWTRSPLPVREIRQALADGGRAIAHTSVITTLNSMCRKKLLSRHMRGNACLFEPRVGQREVSRGMLKDLVDRVFDGSASAVMLSLFERSELTQEELRELRKAIQNKLKQST